MAHSVNNVVVSVRLIGDKLALVLGAFNWSDHLPDFPEFDSLECDLTLLFTRLVVTSPTFLVGDLEAEELKVMVRKGQVFFFCGCFNVSTSFLPSPQEECNGNKEKNFQNRDHNDNKYDYCGRAARGWHTALARCRDQRNAASQGRWSDQLKAPRTRASLSPIRRTDTTTLLTKWAMAELVLHPKVQAKLRREIDSVVGAGRQSTNADVDVVPSGRGQGDPAHAPVGATNEGRQAKHRTKRYHLREKMSATLLRQLATKRIRMWLCDEVVLGVKRPSRGGGGATLVEIGIDAAEDCSRETSSQSSSPHLLLQDCLWMQDARGQSISARLDKAYFNVNWLEMEYDIVVRNLQMSDSDHRAILVTGEDCNRGKNGKELIFELYWLEYLELENVVKESMVKYEAKGMNMTEKLVMLQGDLEKWNRDKVGSLELNLKNTRKRLEELQLEEENDTISNEERMLLRGLLNKVNALCQQIQIKWWSKSRKKWVEGCEKNTKYYHSVVKIRRQSQVDKLEINGVCVKDTNVMPEAMTSWYGKLWENKGVSDFSKWKLDELDWVKLSTQECDVMKRKLSNKEIWNALKSLGRGKSPGLDGFSVEFFIANWEVLKEDFSKLLSWKLVTSNKGKGRLRIRDMKLMKKAFMARRVLPILNMEEKFWASLIVKKYGCIHPWVEAKRSKLSWNMKAITNCMYSLREWPRKKVENGKDTDIWVDPWLGELPICKWPTYINVAALNGVTKVSEMISNNGWEGNIIDVCFGSALSQVVYSIPVDKHVGRDKWVWADNWRVLVEKVNREVLEYLNAEKCKGSPLMVETMAIWYGIDNVKKKGLSGVIVRSDCLRIVNILKGEFQAPWSAHFNTGQN
ncbi:hypothetical protein Cni_G29148 [Canna indica]|uniref:RNase H type-1 domain-containing protein n=1 Tax=Canna indica TaxID=4628 RepID=A0AAQ3L466_9LILI|nr:hypothetical protein Cni_G29148 [Canna indica]